MTNELRKGDGILNDRGVFHNEDDETRSAKNLLSESEPEEKLSTADLAGATQKIQGLHVEERKPNG
jgi:hypothetical protein